MYLEVVCPNSKSVLKVRCRVFICADRNRPSNSCYDLQKAESFSNDMKTMGFHRFILPKYGVDYATLDLNIFESRTIFISLKNFPQCL